MCSFLHVTPKQLGKLREDDPNGMSFLELSFIHRRKEEHKAREKYEKEMKRKSASRKSSRR